MSDLDVTARHSPQAPGRAPTAPTVATLKVRGFDERLPPNLKFVELVARGGMASLVLVEDTRTGVRLAAKLVDITPGDDDGAKRFEREVELGKRFANAGVVPVVEADLDKGVIIFPFLAGGSLEDRLKRGPLPAHAVRALAKSLLSTLAVLHHRGVIHRDVKPANVLFDDANRAFLGDLGVARDEAVHFTMTGMLIGTPAYMAPEQLRGRVVDGRADIYGLGATLFEASTGRRFADLAPGSDVRAFVVAVCGDEALAIAVEAMLVEDAARRPDARAALALVDSAGKLAKIARVALPAAFAVVACAVFATVAHFGAPASANTIAVVPLEVAGDALPARSAMGLAQLFAVRLAESDARVVGPLDLHVSATSPASWLEAARKSGARRVVVGRVERASDGNVVVSFALEDNDKRVEWSTRDVVTDAAVAGAVGARAEELAKRMTKPKEGAAEAFAQAERALNRNNWSGALTALDKAESLGAPVDDVLYLRAVASWWADRPDPETRAVIARALTTVKEPSRRAFLEGLSLFLDADYDEAVHHFERALSATPADRDLLYGLFEAQWHDGAVDEATATYRRIVERWPDFALAAYHVCMHALVSADVEEQAWAFDHFNKDGEYAVPGWRARAKLIAGDTDGAIAVLLEATQKQPSDVVTEELGLAYEVAGEAALARASLATLQPHRENLPLLIARVSGDDAKARALLDDARRSLATDDGEALLYRAVEIVSLDTDPAHIAEAAELASRRLSPALRASGKGKELLLLAEAAAPEVHVADRLGDEKHHEYVPLARALIARREGRVDDERGLVREAAKHDNGRLLTLERFLEAEASRALHDDAGVIAACNAGVIVPRGENPDWPLHVGPCLLWSAESSLRLGKRDDAIKYAKLLLAQRDAAVAGDALVVGARTVLGTAALPR